MVLPPSPADTGAVEARAWLGKLIQTLELARGGVLLGLRGAAPTQLGSVVRALSSAPPWIEQDEHVLAVCLRAAEIPDVEPGSRVLLRVHVDDLTWLNLYRPIFKTRALRTILWADHATFEAMVRNAPDFHDWITRTVDVPEKSVPDFAVAGMAEALRVEAEVSWRGRGLKETLKAAGASERPEIWAESYRSMIEGFGEAGPRCVGGVLGERDGWRVRMARAQAGHCGAWIARDPEQPLVGTWHLHAEQLDWDEATEILRGAGCAHAALVSAWLDLEPERIAEVAKRGSGPVGVDAWDVTQIALADAPTWVLRERTGAESRAAREIVRSSDQLPEEPTAIVAWSEGSAPWSTRDEGPQEARLVRALRALDDGTPTEEFVEVAWQLGFVDVSTALMEIRWWREADFRADRLVQSLMRLGEIEAARKVAEAWQERARTSGDGESLAAAVEWLGKVDLVAETHAESESMVPPFRRSDDELYVKWIDGDQRARNDLLNRYYGKLDRYFASRVGQVDREELLQETFVRLADAPARESLQSTFRACLFAIARRVWSDFMRQRRPGSPPGSLDLGGLLDRPLDNALDCFHELSPESQDLLDLHLGQGLTSEELAVVFAVPIAAIRSRIHASLSQIADCWAPGRV